MINKDKTYKTRDGREVRIYATDGHPLEPIHGAIRDYEDRWNAAIWQKDGSNLYKSRDADLIEVRPHIKRTVWLNVHVNRSVIAHNYREEADNLFCKDVAPRIACIKVDLDFEEGEGL
jgi:hypothetical protein